MIESGVLGTLRIRKYERCSVGGNGKTVYNNSTPSMSIYFGSKLHKVIGEDDIVFDVVGMRFRYATIDDKKTQKVLLRNNKIICIPYNGDDSIQGVYEVEDEGKWFKLYKVEDDGN